MIYELAYFSFALLNSVRAQVKDRISSVNKLILCYGFFQQSSVWGELSTEVIDSRLKFKNISHE